MFLFYIVSSIVFGLLASIILIKGTDMLMAFDRAPIGPPRQILKPISPTEYVNNVKPQRSAPFNDHDAYGDSSISYESSSSISSINNMNTLSKIEQDQSDHQFEEEDLIKKYNTKSKQVLVVRKDLNMSPGKIAAQCVHATLRNKQLKPYEQCDSGHVCICCYVKSEDALYKLAYKAKELNIPHEIQIDAGRTEVEPETATVLSLGPVYKREDIEKLNRLTKRLQLL